MELKEAQEMVEGLMREHNLTEWTFFFDNAKKRVAATWSNKRISFSKHLTPLLSREEVRQSALHEIAHAMTPGHGHNKVWKRTAASIGYTGERLITIESILKKHAQRASSWRKRASLSADLPPLRLGSKLLLDGEIYVVEKVNRVNLVIALDEEPQKKFRMPQHIAAHCVIM